MKYQRAFVCLHLLLSIAFWSCKKAALEAGRFPEKAHKLEVQAMGATTTKDKTAVINGMQQLFNGLSEKEKEAYKDEIKALGAVRDRLTNALKAQFFTSISKADSVQTLEEARKAYEHAPLTLEHKKELNEAYTAKLNFLKVCQEINNEGVAKLFQNLI